jgi:hypothetical protein
MDFFHYNLCWNWLASKSQDAIRMSLVDGLVTFVLLLLTACRLFLLFCLFSPFSPFSSFSFLTLRSSTLYHQHLLVSISTIESGRLSIHDVGVVIFVSTSPWDVIRSILSLWNWVRILFGVLEWDTCTLFLANIIASQLYHSTLLLFANAQSCGSTFHGLRSHFGFATSRNTKSHIKASTTHCLDHGAYIWLKILSKDISR